MWMIALTCAGSTLSPGPTLFVSKLRPITNDKLDLGSSTELITLKPWCTGKQLPLGFSVLGQNRKENYGFYILDSCTNPGACSVFIYGALGIKAQASSSKLQAPSLTSFKQ